MWTAPDGATSEVWQQLRYPPSACGGNKGLSDFLHGNHGAVVDGQAAGRRILFLLKALEVCISYHNKARSFVHFSFSSVGKFIFDEDLLEDFRGKSVFDSSLSSTSFDNIKARKAFLCVGLCNLSTANVSATNSSTFSLFNICLNGFLFSYFLIMVIVIKKAFCFGNWKDSLYSLDIKFLSALLLLLRIELLCSSQKDKHLLTHTAVQTMEHKPSTGRPRLRSIIIAFQFMNLSIYNSCLSWHKKKHVIKPS